MLEFSTHGANIHCELLRCPTVAGSGQETGGCLTKRFLAILALILIAALAIFVKSWWKQGRDPAQSQKLEEAITRLDAGQATLGEALDSVRFAARASLDSLQVWLTHLADSVRALTPDTAESTARAETLESKAARVWQEALRSLPADLSAYERLVAEEELKETLQKRFDLSREQVRAITGGS